MKPTIKTLECSNKNTGEDPIKVVSNVASFISNKILSAILDSLWENMNRLSTFPASEVFALQLYLS